MSRGKYKAKAINRAAAVDNEVIVQLRDELAAVTAERDDALRRLTAEQNDRRAMAAELAKSNIVDLEEEHHNRNSEWQNKVGVVIDRIRKLQREDPDSQITSSSVDTEIIAPLSELAGRGFDSVLKGRKNRIVPGVTFEQIVGAGLGDPKGRLTRHQRRVAGRVLARFAESGADTSKPSKLESGPAGYKAAE